MNSATTATLALPTGPYQQLIPSQGKILQLVRGADGTQYLIQPQQQVVLQQQVLPAVPSGGAQAPVIQQVLTALPGVITQQTGVVIQPQQIVISGNNVPQNAQVVQAAQTGLGAVHGEPQSQWWQQQQQQQLKENDSGEDGGWTS
ncbi:transcription initiation factor IIA subunit 1-like [Megalops cyprinoides]|uniref:transcription initiation factor IIA subunit 1-like n=1 Tax=Megalops cyprinoides TaxID=118141 RepID=UPI0018646C7A|nr:transcription initiation factor IIA subunit 1-like [Megalops cyprinoides]